MANALKQRSPLIEGALSGYKIKLASLANGIKSSLKTLFLTGYGSHGPTSRALDSDIVSIQMQYRYGRKR